MWQTALKLLAVYLLRDRMNKAKSNIQHDFSAAKENIASIAERHALQFKEDFANETGRIAKSVTAFLFAMLFTMFAGLTALMWIFALAWSSPNRTLILVSIIIVALVIAFGLALRIANSWQKKPLFGKTMQRIETDWYVFKQGLSEDQRPD